jgi:two-component system, chemotaxis family, chemotaxis protein CheY
MDTSDQAIIIADPSAVIRKMLGEVVKEMGYRPVYAVDGPQVMQRAFQEMSLLKLVVMEWLLPKKEALDVLMEFKQTEELRTVPVVIVTSAAGKVSVIKALENGAADYIVKPFGKENMKQKLQNFIVKK